MNPSTKLVLIQNHPLLNIPLKHLIVQHSIAVFHAGIFKLKVDECFLSRKNPVAGVIRWNCLSRNDHNSILPVDAVKR